MPLDGDLRGWVFESLNMLLAQGAYFEPDDDGVSYDTRAPEDVAHELMRLRPVPPAVELRPEHEPEVALQVVRWRTMLAERIEFKRSLLPLPRTVGTPDREEVRYVRDGVTFPLGWIHRVEGGGWAATSWDQAVSVQLSGHSWDKQDAMDHLLLAAARTRNTARYPGLWA